MVATNELFRRHGYNGTSLSQISHASGATIGSIYHFFPGGKEALALAVIDATGDVYRELFESIVAEAESPWAAFIDFFTSAATALEETDFIDPCPIGTIAREVASSNEPLRQAAERAFRILDCCRTHPSGSCGSPARRGRRTGGALRLDRRGHVRTQQDSPRHRSGACRWPVLRRTRRAIGQGHDSIPRLAQRPETEAPQSAGSSPAGCADRGIRNAAPLHDGWASANDGVRLTPVGHVRAGALNEIGRQTRRGRWRGLVPPVARGSAAVSGGRGHGTGNQPACWQVPRWWLMEVQIPYVEVQIADFSSVPPHVAMIPSTRGGMMTAPTTMQIAGFHGDVIAPTRMDTTVPFRTARASSTPSTPTRTSLRRSGGERG